LILINISTSDEKCVEFFPTYERLAEKYSNIIFISLDSAYKDISSHFTSHDKFYFFRNRKLIHKVLADDYNSGYIESIILSLID